MGWIYFVTIHGRVWQKENKTLIKKVNVPIRSKYDMISTTVQSVITTSLNVNATPSENFNVNSSSIFDYQTTYTSNFEITNFSNFTYYYNYYNDTSNPVFPSYIRTTSMVFCIIIMCLGVIGNVMVPIVIFRTKDMRNSTNIFLVNLSVADLMVLLVCTPTVLVEVNSKPETWVLGEEMCKCSSFIFIASDILNLDKLFSKTLNLPPQYLWDLAETIKQINSLLVAGHKNIHNVNLVNNTPHRCRRHWCSFGLGDYISKKIIIAFRVIKREDVWLSIKIYHRLL